MVDPGHLVEFYYVSVYSTTLLFMYESILLEVLFFTKRPTFFLFFHAEHMAVVLNVVTSFTLEL